jgi:protein-S-isoprenylcysteine O-methyltransferase Ste14
MLLGGVFIVIGLALLICGWMQAYAANRHSVLATQGLYGVVRHPQYAGIMLAVFGQIVHWPTIITLALFPLIIFAYVRLARSEETQLNARFGDQYLAYRQSLPMFLPRITDSGRLLRALFYRGRSQNSEKVVR